VSRLRLVQHPLLWFIAVLAWMRLVWYLSSIPGDGSPPLIPHIDKLMHFLGFAVGGMLMAGLLASVTRTLMRCKARWDCIIPATAILIGLFGWLDEWHQCFTPGRHGADLADWVADFLGGIAGALLFRAIFHRLVQDIDRIRDIRESERKD
jgi:VanZ family protein